MIATILDKMACRKKPELVAATLVVLLCVLAETRAAPTAEEVSIDGGDTTAENLIDSSSEIISSSSLPVTIPVMHQSDNVTVVGRGAVIEPSEETGQSDVDEEEKDEEEAEEGGAGVSGAEAEVDERVYFGYGRPKPAPLSMGGYSPASGGSKGDCAVQCQWEDYEPVCNANGRRVAQSACEARCMGLFANQYRSSWCGVPKQRGGSWWGRKLKMLA